MGKLLAICISEKRGTQKFQIPEAELKENWGIVGDAHAGNWHRQVSLLDIQQIEEFRSKGANVEFGAFGENLITEGFDWRSVQVGSRILIGECELEKPGDEMKVEPIAKDHPYTAAVITLSDRAYNQEYEDRSGPEIVRILAEKGYDVVEALLLPDGIPMLKSNLIRLADQRQVNVIFTTGGTGFAPRDLTPEATVAVCDRMADAITQAILYKSLEITDRAMLSRQRAGIRGKTLIVNLPGSPKACREDLGIILPALEHGLGILRGTAAD